MSKAESLGLVLEQGLGQESKVLKSPKQRLGTRKTRRNQSTKERIQEVA
jgi:hypothetical protein